MHSLTVHHHPTPDARHPSPLRPLAIVALWATMLTTFAGCISGDCGRDGYRSGEWWTQPEYLANRGPNDPDLSGLIGAILQCAF
jgi:hypothetical protein